MELNSFENKNKYGSCEVYIVFMIVVFILELLFILFIIGL